MRDNITPGCMVQHVRTGRIAYVVGMLENGNGYIGDTLCFVEYYDSDGIDIVTIDSLRLYKRY